MKKKLLIIVAIMFAILTVTGCGSKNSANANTNSAKSSDDDKHIEDVVKNATEDKQGDIVFNDIKITEFGATNIVSGKARNSGSSTKNIKLTLKMFNSTSSKLLGRVSTELIDLKAGETRDFEIRIMGDYSLVDQFKVEVENL